MSSIRFLFPSPWGNFRNGSIFLPSSSCCFLPSLPLLQELEEDMDDVDGDDDDEADFGDEMFADEDLDLKQRWVW